MKKIVLTAAATLALGVAACTPAANEAGNNAVDTNLTENKADVDVNGAAALDVNGAAAVAPPTTLSTASATPPPTPPAMSAMPPPTPATRSPTRSTKPFGFGRNERVACRRARGPFYLRPPAASCPAKAIGRQDKMKKYGAMAALLACASLLAACGREEDGSPTAAENEQLNNISEVLDTSADSLVAEDPALGNGEAGSDRRASRGRQRGLQRRGGERAINAVIPAKAGSFA